MKIYIFCNKVLFLHKDIHTFFVQEYHILEDVRESNDFYIPHQYWAVHYRTTSRHSIAVDPLQQRALIPVKCTTYGVDKILIWTIYVI